MPTLSLRIIKKPRRFRRCDTCGKGINGETIRLYGMAEYGDKPYNVFLHRGCLSGKNELAMLDAIEHRLQADAAMHESERRFMAGAKLGLQNGLAHEVST
ncbi:MAG: hypothetical protein CVU44_11160 [Chloroflexi bacterium HGW-Chloroflexi-6]|nr:MAG: hypothetical protein CVU44_11160 [Chloroflexi bacterium HGW-Chloroflexi-6]